MVKGDNRPALASRRPLARSDAYPVHLAVQPVRFGFGANATHANNRLEVPAPDLAHAVVDAEQPLGIRIAGVSSLVDESAHQLAPAVVTGEIRPHLKPGCVGGQVIKTAWRSERSFPSLSVAFVAFRRFCRVLRRGLRPAGARS